MSRGPGFPLPVAPWEALLEPWHRFVEDDEIVMPGDRMLSGDGVYRGDTIPACPEHVGKQAFDACGSHAFRFTRSTVPSPELPSIPREPWAYAYQDGGYRVLFEQEKDAEAFQFGRGRGIIVPLVPR